VLTPKTLFQPPSVHIRRPRRLGVPMAIARGDSAWRSVCQAVLTAETNKHITTHHLGILRRSRGASTSHKELVWRTSECHLPNFPCEGLLVTTDL
jgi:hypothetical protein